MSERAAPLAAQGARMGDRGRIAVALLAVYLIWSSTYLAIEYALVSFAPFALAAIRFIAAGALLLIVLRFQGTLWPTPRQWLECAFIGTLLLGVGNGGVCYAQLTVSSGIAAVGVASMPLFAAAFAALRGQWPTTRDRLGLAIGFAGVVLLHAGSELRATFAGALALLAAPVAWAYGSVWSRGRDLPGPWMSTAAQMLCGGIALALVSVASGEPLPRAPTPLALGALLYLIVAGSLIGYTAYVYLLGKVRPALATSYAYVNPPLAIALGVLLLGEHFSAQEALATSVMLIGVAMILTTRR
jgi:drug/metabolite transporter (DMT)-like permease